MVTTVILPAVKRLASADDRIALFESIEAPLCLAGAGDNTGHRAERFLHDPPTQCLGSASPCRRSGDAYDGAGLVLFTLMLFVLEPLVLRRLFLRQAAINPQRVLQSCNSCTALPC